MTPLDMYRERGKFLAQLARDDPQPVSCTADFAAAFVETGAVERIGFQLYGIGDRDKFATLSGAVMTTLQVLSSFNTPNGDTNP